MQQNIRKYILTKRLARKTLRSTYLALSTIESEHKFLVKVFDTASLNLNITDERRLQSINQLKALNHEHLVSILDIQMVKEKLYVVREYLPYTSLRKRLDDPFAEPLSLPAILHFCLQLGQALSSIHQQHHLHGNLQPDNIFLEDDENALLTDFSIQDLIDSTTSDYTSDPHSTPYLAPEQFAGESSPQSDQYALACIIYEALTGQVPFPSSPLNELYTLYTREAPASPSTIRAEIPATIDAAILRALATNPAERHPNIATFIEHLESFYSQIKPALSAAELATLQDLENVPFDMLYQTPDPLAEIPLDDDEPSVMLPSSEELPALTSNAFLSLDHLTLNNEIMSELEQTQATLSTDEESSTLTTPTTLDEIDANNETDKADETSANSEELLADIPSEEYLPLSDLTLDPAEPSLITSSSTELPAWTNNPALPLALQSLEQTAIPEDEALEEIQTTPHSDEVLSAALTTTSLDETDIIDPEIEAIQTTPHSDEVLSAALTTINVDETNAIANGAEQEPQLANIASGEYLPLPSIPPVSLEQGKPFWDNETLADLQSLLLASPTTLQETDEQFPDHTDADDLAQPIIPPFPFNHKALQPPILTTAPETLEEENAAPMPVPANIAAAPLPAAQTTRPINMAIGHVNNAQAGGNQAQPLHRPQQKIWLPRRYTPLSRKRILLLVAAVLILTMCATLQPFTSLLFKTDNHTPIARQSTQGSVTTTATTTHTSPLKNGVTPTPTSSPTSHPTTGSTPTPTKQPSGQPGTTNPADPGNTTPPGSTSPNPNPNNNHPNPINNNPNPVNNNPNPVNNNTKPTATPTPTPPPLVPHAIISSFYYQEYNQPTNLTYNGSSDWKQWGYNSSRDVNSKASGQSQISNVQSFGGSLNSDHYNPIDFSWSDGTPVTSTGAVTAGITIGNAAGSGFTFTVASSTSPRTLRVYIGAHKARARLSVSLQDARQSDDSLDMTNDPVHPADNGMYTIVFSTNVPDQPLTVTVQLEQTTGNQSGIILEAAALQ